jgi:cytochrome c oxidase subunit 3
LLASGIAVTWAHHALLNGNRWGFNAGLLLTIVLGVLFMVCQTYAYMHTNFRLAGNIHDASFVMASGFHGGYVMVGMLFLLAALAGRFTPTRHFAFEAAAWYWHFVDAAWLGLFLFACAYLLGAGTPAPR